MKSNAYLVTDHSQWSIAELKIRLAEMRVGRLVILDFGGDFEFQARVDREIAADAYPDRLNTAALVQQQFQVVKTTIDQYIAGISKVMIPALQLPDEPHFNPWYLGLVHEKNPHKSKHFFDLASAAVIRGQIAIDEPGHLILAARGKEMRRLCRDLCRERGMEMTDISPPPRRSLKTRFRELALSPDVAAAGSPWIKYLWRKFLCAKLNRQTPHQSAAAFVTYFPYYDEEGTTTAELRNHYYTPGLEKLFTKHHVNPTWIALYVPFRGITYSQATAKARDLARKEIHVEFLERWLGIGDFVQAWKIWRTTRKSASGFLTTYPSWFDRSLPLHLTEDLWKTSLMRSISMQGILQYLAFKRFHAKNPHLKKLFYVCEMQAWEKAMLMASEAAATPPESIGFQHAALSSGYLNYFYDAAEKTPLPKILLTNSPWMQSRFQEFLPRVELVEALRQNYLEAIVGVSSAVAGKRCFAVFTSLSIENTTTLLSFLKQAFLHPPPFEILLKLHPSLNIDLDAYAFAGLKVTTLDAGELLSRSFGCLVPDSTVAFEAVALGVPCLTPLFANEVALSPCLDFPEIGGVVSRPEDLARRAADLYLAALTPKPALSRELLARI